MVAPPAPLPPDVPSISAEIEAKARLRARMRAERAAIPADVAGKSSDAAARRLVAGLAEAAGSELALFLSLPGEIDTGPLIRRLLVGKTSISLPRMIGRDQPLVFHRWQPGDELSVGSMRVREPLPGSRRIAPDIVIVPLLAFDLDGYRLGYGGGFYDRTLAALRAAGPILAIGFAFEMQRVDRVPRAAYDQPLDRVVTEAAAHVMPPAGA